MNARLAADDPDVHGGGRLHLGGRAGRLGARSPPSATPPPPPSSTSCARSRASSKLSEPVPPRWGEFAILGEIGHGAYGTVYRAHDDNLNLDVALKVIRPRQPAPFLNPDRALNEARLLAQLSHPNIVRIFGAAPRRRATSASRWSCCSGRTLEELVAQQGPFNAREAMLVRRGRLPGPWRRCTAPGSSTATSRRRT